MRRLLAERLSRKAIAARLGVAPETLQRFLKGRGIEAGHARPGRVAIGRATGEADRICGRSTLGKKADEVAAHFHLADLPGLLPRYNIAPWDARRPKEVAAIKADGSFATMRWRFIPRGSRATTVDHSDVNAKRETVAGSRAYGDAYRGAAVAAFRPGASRMGAGRYEEFRPIQA